LKSTIHQLETEVEHVKRMEENQRYFFSAASHELKTPIAAAGAIFEGMLSDVIAPEEYPAYLREGMKLVKEQNRLISEILELVKLSGEMPAPKKETIQILHCVTGVLESLSPLIESKEQVLTVDVPDDITCELNDGLFSKALSNILLNATQNSPNGSEIRITANDGQGNICLTIWNGDTQISNDMLPKLFEPFYRADEARTSGEGRSGLGLAIVKKTLDLMGIPFMLKNIDGGVMFSMDIPKD
jgi:two-component system sensor histidine kinase VanS